MRVCEVCKKGSMIQKSGAHQYGGGWAMRATKKRVVFKVNLHSVKVTYNDVRRTMRLCTKCLRKVKKQMTESESKKTDEILIRPKVKESVSAATV